MSYEFQITDNLCDFHFNFDIIFYIACNYIVSNILKMEFVKLIEPEMALEKEHAEMLKEWQQTQEELVPFTLKYDTSNFKKYIEQINGFKKGIGIPKTFVPHSTFWLVNEKQKILGVSNIRHFLNEGLIIEGGHIGFGIRPLERKKGYATEILRLSLIEARKLKIECISDL